MDLNETKAWTGKKDDGHTHVLGQMRVQQLENGDRLVVLDVYRDLTAESPAEVDVCNIVHGKSFIRCNVDGCDYVGVWQLRKDLIRAIAKNQNVSMYAAE